MLSVPEHPSALSATPCQPASVPVHSAVCVPSVHRMDAASAGAWASRVTSSPGQNSTSSGRSGSGTSHTSTSVSAVRVSPQTSVRVAVYRVVSSGWAVVMDEFGLDNPSTGLHDTDPSSVDWRTNCTPPPAQTPCSGGNPTAEDVMQTDCWLLDPPVEPVKPHHTSDWPSKISSMMSSCRTRRSTHSK